MVGVDTPSIVDAAVSEVVCSDAVVGSAVLADVSSVIADEVALEDSAGKDVVTCSDIIVTEDVLNSVVTLEGEVVVSSVTPVLPKVDMGIDSVVIASVVVPSELGGSGVLFSVVNIAEVVTSVVVADGVVTVSDVSAGVDTFDVTGGVVSLNVVVGVVAGAVLDSCVSSVRVVTSEDVTTGVVPSGVVADGLVLGGVPASGVVSSDVATDGVVADGVLF